MPRLPPKRHGDANAVSSPNSPLGPPVLLDEMFSGVIAAQLRARRHDVIAAVEDASLVGLSDEEIFASAADAGRALVTANIKDFVPLDQRYKATGRTHAGLVLISSKAFPQDRSFTGAVVTALDRLLDKESLRPDVVTFLQRGEPASPDGLKSGQPRRRR